MIPPLLGAATLLGSLGLVGLLLMLTLVSQVRGRRELAKKWLFILGAVVVGFGVVWVVGLVTTPHRTVAVGDEVHFCGVDCHLHIAVVKSTRDRDLGVTLRFRSDAKQADEFPSLLRYVVMDDAGQRYLPSSGLLGAPLKAGETIEQEFRFSLPTEARNPRLLIYYGGVMDYLVPGEGNSLAQRRSELALGGG